MIWFKQGFKPCAALALSLGAAALLAPDLALADAGACVTFHASGQRGMRSGALRQAAKDFTACGSDESCPAAVRNECVELYASVERMLPTVIFSVVDEQGRDVTAVKVSSGEELLLQSLDGRAVPFDPGKYQFKIELPWGEVVTQDVLIREGEKNRLVSLKVKDPSQVAPAVTAPPTSGTVPEGGAPLPPEKPNRTPPAFWVMAGVGVAAVGTGAVFEILGYTQHSDLADCSPRCPASRRDDYDTIQRNYLIGDIALGVGVVSLGVAAVIFATSGSAKEASSAAAAAPRLAITPTFGGRGATVQLAGVTF